MNSMNEHPQTLLTTRAHTPPRLFNLVRSFSKQCAAGILIVVALLLVTSSRIMNSALLNEASARNTEFAKTLINAVWPEYANLAVRAHTVPQSELESQPENLRLRDYIEHYAPSLNVVGIRIHTLKGQTAYSDWKEEIGTIRDQYVPVLAALKDGSHSSLFYEENFTASDHTVRDRHIIKTFTPVDNPVTHERQGVLEIQTDVSNEIAADARTRWLIAALLTLSMGVLYVFLLLAVRRAERLMQDQQNALNDSNRRLNLLGRVVEQSKDAIMTRDLDGAITSWNDGAESIFGFSKAEAIGKTMRSLKIKECNDEQWQIQLGALRAGADQQTRGWHQTKSGQRVHIVSSVGPLHDDSGKLIGDIAMSHDTPWLKRAQEELRRATDKAESAARAKDEFLANMSHEIRTPMNGIIGMTNLALETKLDAEQRDYLTTVKYSADALLQIINDILDFSKIEAGKLGIENIPFALRLSLEQTVRAVAIRAHEKRLELICAVDNDVPDEVIGDPLRLRQIVLNLLGNAIKFTAEGEVEIRVSAVAVTKKSMQLRFSVRDTGIGIPLDKQDAIFNAFEQADTSTTRQYGGTGLGLSITRKLVSLMNGTIQVNSAPGNGSTFEFFLSLGRQTAPVASNPEVAPLPASCLAQPVLVLDDNARCRELLCDYVRSLNMMPIECDSSAAGLAHWITAKAAGKPFRLLIVDGNLPGAIEFAKSSEDDAMPPAVIVLADTTQAHAVARSFKNPAVRMLLKPVAPSTLRETISVLFDPALHQIARESPSPLQKSIVQSRQLEVLLVEDNAVNRKLASRLLERLGHRVSEAHDGSQAVAITGSRQFDVVLMDMQMPVMDGLEATRTIRLREGNGYRIPIIALTANAMSGDRERCIDAGMDDYVTKPIDLAALAAALDRVALPAPNQAGTANAPEIAPGMAIEAAGQADGPTYDHAKALERTGDDAELLAQIIDIYLEETPALLVEIAGHLENGNLECAFRAAHTVKGSSSNLSATAVIEAARKVELAARANDIAGAQAAFPALQENAQRLLQTLESERRLQSQTD